MDSRIIYWCETHNSDGVPRLGQEPFTCWKGEYLVHLNPEDCSMVQRRPIPLEVSEEMVEAAARAMHMRTGKPRGAIEPFILDARAALNAALGGNDE